MVAYDIASILEGPVRILAGNASNAAIPDVLPADSVAIFGPFGGNWRELGYTTEDGITFTFEANYGDVMTAQDRGSVKRLKGTSNERVACSLLEVTLENFKEVAGYGTITTTPAGVSTFGHRDLSFDNTTPPQYKAICVEGIAPPDEDDCPRRIFFPYAASTATGDVVQRIGQPSTLPCAFARQGTGVNSIVVIRDVLAPTG